MRKIKARRTQTYDMFAFRGKFSKKNELTATNLDLRQLLRIQKLGGYNGWTARCIFQTTQP